jgi:hypothetical protein
VRAQPTSCGLIPNTSGGTVDIAPDDRDRVAFLRAATWPDFIRDAADYTSDGPDGGNRLPPGPEAGQNKGYSDLFMHKY